MIGSVRANRRNEDSDAMRKGVNCLLVPREWADNLGAATIVKALDNLREACATRYRVSLLLRRKALTASSVHAMEE